MATARVRAAVERFKREVQHFAKTLGPEQLVPFHKKVTLELLRRLVLGTPVDTGRARGNWQVSQGGPRFDERPPDLGGANVINDGLRELTGLKPFSVVFISNNVPYIIPLEMGHSRQAPTGFIAASIEEVTEIFD